MGWEEFSFKLNSIPKDEPLYEIIKSRVIELSKIKDKDEKKYWQELKRANRIPDIYKSDNMIYSDLKRKVNMEGNLLNETRKHNRV